MIDQRPGSVQCEQSDIHASSILCAWRTPVKTYPQKYRHLILLKPSRLMSPFGQAGAFSMPHQLTCNLSLFYWVPAAVFSFSANGTLQSQQGLVVNRRLGNEKSSTPFSDSADLRVSLPECPVTPWNIRTLVVICLGRVYYS